LVGFQVEGGGNAGNALTCAARLGLNPRLISKVADDVHGNRMLRELEADGIDTSFLIVSLLCPSNIEGLLNLVHAFWGYIPSAK